MNDSGYGDIIIMALIAVFLLLRLRSILGQTNGDEQERAEMRKQVIAQMEERIVQVSEKLQRKTDTKESKEEEETLVLEPARSVIRQLCQADAQFSAKMFLEGAKIAFEMVHRAFQSGDKAQLKTLLSPNIYAAFEQEIDARNLMTNKPDSTLLAIESAVITNAEKFGNSAKITVEFTSEQAHVERGPDGKIVSGDPSASVKVEDVWVFERDVTSRDPNWRVTDT